MLLKDKVVLVTAGGSGIGRAAARIVAEAGAKVFVTDIDEAAAGETAGLVSAAGGHAASMRVDVAREDDITAMIERAVEVFGRIDGAFNNAGLRRKGMLVPDLRLDDWDAAMQVNLTGMFLCVKHQVRAMRETGGGAIVNTSSGDGVVGHPNSAEYCASKHGVIGLTRAAACEAAETRVRVNAVLPGLIVTPRHDEAFNDPDTKKQFDAHLARHTVGRFGRPEDVGYAVKWLLSDEASFINGAAVAVDGGYTAA